MTGEAPRAEFEGDIARLIDAVYPDPEQFLTAEAFSRAHHDDIASLKLDEIDAERILARMRWSLVIHRRQEPSAWLVERIARLDEAAAARRRQSVRR